MAVAEEPYLLALYGSRARGDHDGQSDVDVLAVGRTPPMARSTCEGSRTHVSDYTWPEFEAMHGYGSLFLWHLKLHSKPLEFNRRGYDRFCSLMSTLPEYSGSRVHSDIESFKLSLSDVEDALVAGDTTYEYELSCVATTVRHSTILGCYLLGAPEFGRYSSVRKFCKATGLPASLASEFVELYQFRMVMNDGVAAWRPGRVSLASYAESWLVKSRSIVEEVAGCAIRTSA